MNGKFVVAGIVLISLFAGGAMYYLQEYGYYRDAVFSADSLRMVPIVGGVAEPMVADGVTGIDADSSPLRFRACFTTPTSLATLTETYRVYEGATPLTAPGWFPCFDADAIGEALERGEAIAFLSEAGVRSVTDPATGDLRASGVDRVIAVFPDGRAYAWHQLAPNTDD